MRLPKSPIVPLVMLALLIGCASSGASSGDPPSKPKTRTSSPDYVTSMEIQATPASNAYEVISRLRPRWLQTTAPGSLSGGGRSQVIAVYVDGVRVGAKEGLRSISASSIKTMQYYDASRAATILRGVGSEPIAGAIVITTTQIQ
jgi:hypothetical protein